MSGTRIRDSVAAQEGMASLPGGTFFVGSDEFSPEEQQSTKSRSERSRSTAIPSPWPSFAVS